MKLEIKRLNDLAVLPKKAHASDAGLDLTATSKTIDEHGNIVYGTGLAILIPEGHVGLIFPRSSNAKCDLILTNSVGVIDCGYTGEVTLKFKPCLHAEDNQEIVGCDFFEKSYSVGDRVGQLIVIPIPDVDVEEIFELPDSERGNGGYGSSGR